MTREERVKKLKADIEELGILAIEDAESLEAMEMVVSIIRDYDKKNPPEYSAAHIKFIEDNKKLIKCYIWNQPHLYQELYFNLLQGAQNKMKEAGIKAEDTVNLLKMACDPETFANAMKSFEYRVCDPGYNKELPYITMERK
jgi:hypothetical protein